MAPPRPPAAIAAITPTVRIAATIQPNGSLRRGGSAVSTDAVGALGYGVCIGSGVAARAYGPL